MPTLFKKAQLRHEKEEKLAQERAHAREIERQKNAPIAAYQEKIKALILQLDELSKALSTRAPENKLILALKEYIVDIPQTIPRHYARVSSKLDERMAPAVGIDNVRANFAHLRMDFAKEFISEISKCLDNADRENHRSFFTKEMQPFNVQCNGFTLLSDKFITKNRNHRLYMIGSLLRGITPPLTLISALFITFSFIASTTLHPALFAFLIGCVCGLLGSLLILLGDTLCEMAKEKRLPAETNQQVLERDKDERSELMGYAKELFFHGNEASIDGEKTTDISTSNSFA